MRMDAVLRRTQDQVSCPLRDEAAVLNYSTGQYYGLDAVGARVWQLIDGCRTLSEIGQVLRSEYDVAPERCDADLSRFVSHLAGAGLIEVAG